MKPNEKSPEKCSWGDGITIRPDGEHELDPCIYRDEFIARNVTVIISKCVRCGHVSFGWKEQPDTEILLDLIEDEDSEEDTGGENI